VSDTDGDDICDPQESDSGSPDPGQTNRYLPDSDGDGLWDGVEDQNKNGQRDPGETDGRHPDSDRDGYEDGIEVLLLTSDPLDAGSPGTPIVDGDADTLPAALDPDDGNADVDADRYLDGYEAAQLGLAAVEDPEQMPRLGDVNGDDFRDNADSQQILNFFARLPEAVLDPAHGDLNRDGFVDNADAQWSLVFFARQLPYLPAGL
jgi:hypothetical protein